LVNRSMYFLYHNGSAVPTLTPVILPAAPEHLREGGSGAQRSQGARGVTLKLSHRDPAQGAAISRSPF
jgi:hypothetical protein